MDDLPSSISFDKRPYAQDIQGSMVHAKMLCTPRRMRGPSRRDWRETRAGRVKFPAESEDIHMWVEQLLAERIGEAGKKLHIDRSRND